MLGYSEYMLGYWGTGYNWACSCVFLTIFLGILSISLNIMSIFLGILTIFLDIVWGYSQCVLVTSRPSNLLRYSERILEISSVRAIQDEKKMWERQTSRRTNAKSDVNASKVSIRPAGNRIVSARTARIKRKSVKDRLLSDKQTYKKKKREEWKMMNSRPIRFVTGEKQ